MQRRARLVLFAILLAIVGAAWPTGALQFAYFRMRLACVDDPEQGWATRDEMVTKMANSWGFCRAFARDASMKRLKARMDWHRFSWYDQGLLNRRSACFAGLSKDVVVQQLGSPALETDTELRYETCGIFDQCFVLSFSMRNDRVAGFQAGTAYDGAVTPNRDGLALICLEQITGESVTLTVMLAWDQKDAACKLQDEETLTISFKNAVGTVIGQEVRQIAIPAAFKARRIQILHVPPLILRLPAQASDASISLGRSRLDASLSLQDTP